MKPPIGIMPKRFYEIAVKDEGNKNDYLRFIDLRDAIKRYKDAEFNVPTEWYDALYGFFATYFLKASTSSKYISPS